MTIPLTTAKLYFSQLIVVPMKFLLQCSLLVQILLTALPISAQSNFSDGPLIKGYGNHAAVNLSRPLDVNSKFKVAFDVSDTNGEASLNRKFDSLARFLNMHVANGVDPKNIQLALVVHSKAGFDLLNQQHYGKKFNVENPNTGLVNALLNNNVEIYLCGQSAAYYGINKEQLIEGVQMSLSAMTANAQLSQRGFSTNPF